MTKTFTVSHRCAHNEYLLMHTSLHQSLCFTHKAVRGEQEMDAQTQQMLESEIGIIPFVPAHVCAPIPCSVFVNSNLMQYKK